MGLLCCYSALVLGALTLLICQVVSKILSFYERKPDAEFPPGSRGLPLIGETLQFMAANNSSKGVYDFVKTRRLRYGKCFQAKILGETHVFVSSMESARAVLSSDQGGFTKKYIKTIAELLGDQSLLCASQQHHRMLRGHLIRLFSSSSLSLFIKQFDPLVVDAIRGWRSGSTVFILDEALKITCKAMCKMLVGVESGFDLEVLQEGVARICEAMLSLPWRLPWTRFNKGLQGRKRIMKILENIISKRRNSGAYHDDFLGQLLTGDKNSGTGEASGLTDAEIKDNILTMIIAGQDTTASAITWMVKFLDENQEILKSLRSEHLQLENKMSTTPCLSIEDIGEMSYASKVVKESLRMASVVPWFPRLALQDSEVEGFKIKKGWNINIDSRSLHLDPLLFNDPNMFSPSRFDEEHSKPYSFLAFGTGSRQCLGMNMAKTMMLVFLHRLITTYRWEAIDSDSSIEKWALFSKLKSGYPVILTRLSEDTAQ